MNEELNKTLDDHKKWLENPYTGKRADLSEANLSDANLSDADLSDANLFYTNLSDANLSGANLSGADLSGADLSYVNLSGADLSKANLSGADLSKANLSGANLSGADLSGADLSDANFFRVKGIATKEEEMVEAARILALIKSTDGKINMKEWHTCETSHCLAGWCLPHLEFPAKEAALKIPTLSKYFFLPELSHTDAIAALERVASGEESIYNV